MSVHYGHGVMNEKTERFEMLKKVDEWRRKQDDLPNRSEAMRALIELGLAAPAPRKAKGKSA